MAEKHEPFIDAKRFANGRGLVLGKFFPPHLGHQFLIDFARHYCGELTILVCTLDRDPIPGKLRYEWVRQMAPFGNVRVVHVADNTLPQTPDDHPDFWTIWRDVIRGACPDGVDYFFASEDYGPQTAEAIGCGCRYVEVDRTRELIPISGTAIRADPMRHWKTLPSVVRPYFVKRVCILGPESTGKSTLSRDLAQYFKTVFAWEYARPMLDPQGGRCRGIEDIDRIVRGQIATEDALARQANRVLICDTDALTSTIWSDALFGATSPWIRELVEARCYDLYLLCDVDVPWIDDDQRFFGDEHVRREMFDRFRGALDQRGRKYQTVRGDWTTRFATARDAVAALL